MAKQLKLSTKLIGGFTLISLIIAFVGLVGVYSVIKIGKSFDICMDREVPMADSSMEGTIALITARDLMGEFLLTEDPTVLSEIEKEFAKSNKDFKEHTQYITANGDATLKELSVQAEQYHAKFEANALELIKHQRAHLELEKKSEAVMMDFDAHVESLRDLLLRYEEDLTREARIDEKVDAAMEAKAIMFHQQALVEEYMRSEHADETEKLRQGFESLKAGFDKLEHLLPHQVVNEHADFVKMAMAMFNFHDEKLKMTIETRNHMALVDEFSKKAGSSFDEIEKSTGQSMDRTMANADATQNTVTWSITIVSLGGFILGILFGWLISRGISRPIMRIVENLGNGSDQVASASGQVSSSSQDLAEGASEQAAALEETSSSLDEMSTMTRKNAEFATQANSLMDETKSVIGRAASSMKEMTEAMSRISSSGEEINKIIKTIDEIAFQTNLLALNAAVEAARAGEAGAGFAVVAEEVRSLAQRAAEAARNTSGLIEGTISQIILGTQLVQTTDEAFSEVTQSSVKVAELVSEIASASNEQAKGIDQISQAISQMDKVVQSSAAGAEESASAAEEMNAMAESMRQLVVELTTVVQGADNVHDDRPHLMVYESSNEPKTVAATGLLAMDGDH